MPPSSLQRGIDIQGTALVAIEHGKVTERKRRKLTSSREEGIEWARSSTGADIDFDGLSTSKPSPPIISEQPAQAVAMQVANNASEPVNYVLARMGLLEEQKGRRKQ